jgi:16S rRNA (guanine527-N7)-methyltransferase
MFHVKHRKLGYEKMIDFVLEHNKNINLTAIRDRDEALSKHVEDSLVASDYIQKNHPQAAMVLDLGTGAGFPGLVIAMENPTLNVTLLDSTEKKIRFVHQAVEFLDLKNAHPVADRAETYAIKNKATYDVVIARSVARLDALLEYAAPLLKVGGVLLAMKSVETKEELEIGHYVAKLFGFAPAEVHAYTLLDQDRTILSFTKTRKPSIDLPRKIGAAVNNPIQRGL